MIQSTQLFARGNQIREFYAKAQDGESEGSICYVDNDLFDKAKWT